MNTINNNKRLLGDFMNSEIELKLLKEIDKLKKEISILKGKDENQIPTYQNLSHY